MAKKTGRYTKEEKLTWQQSVVMYMHDLIYMLITIMVLFLLVFRVIVVSGSSMYSTLIDGDYLLLVSNQFYRNPQYGDIVVASKKGFDNGAPIIKRVIATEGQTVDIDFEQGVVFVDGQALQEDYTYTFTNIDEGMRFPLTVAQDCVFVMGDNRNRSLDSRSPEIGQVDKREILGKAIYLFLPGTDEGHTGPDFERMGAIK
ncbi:MAG: signal peptidase I [Faecousia sp.]